MYSKTQLWRAAGWNGCTDSTPVVADDDDLAGLDLALVDRVDEVSAHVSEATTTVSPTAPHDRAAGSRSGRAWR
jgi:hypothetical protein